MTSTAMVTRVVREAMDSVRQEHREVALRGMEHNLEYARRALARDGHVNDYMKGHFCAAISTYATIAGTPEAQELKRQMTNEIMAMPGAAPFSTT